MTALFRSVPITSAEQAEALPVGTIAKDGDLSVAVKAEDGHWARTDVADGLPMMTGGSMVGWTALVPIEAEEEGRSMYTDPDTGETRHDFFPDRQADGSPVHTHTRLVTRWEEA